MRAAQGHRIAKTLLKADLSCSAGQRRRDNVLFGYQYTQAEYRPDLPGRGPVSFDFDYHGPMAGLIRSSRSCNGSN